MAPAPIHTNAGDIIQGFIHDIREGAIIQNKMSSTGEQHKDYDEQQQSRL